MPRVLITGGAGVLGQELVSRFRDAGYTARVMSRRPRPAHAPPDLEWAQADLATGAGLKEALAGAPVVIHSAMAGTREADVDGMGRLIEAARAAQAAHLLYVSIVGIERIPLDYYRLKVEAEQLLAASDVPWSILRATQFHQLIERRLASAAASRLFMPLDVDLQFQPIDPGEVAERIREAAAAGPDGRLPDIGGPEVHRLGDLARVWLRARGLRRLIIPRRAADAVSAGYRRGDNTCPQHRYGRITWAEWLQRNLTTQPIPHASRSTARRAP
jgi:uncharacterized protein YbjT (DUF2867 family)